MADDIECPTCDGTGGVRPDELGVGSPEAESGISLFKRMIDEHNTGVVLRHLGANLAQAAALCLAFGLGDEYAQDVAHIYAGGFLEFKPWQPGCGRDAK